MNFSEKKAFRMQARRGRSVPNYIVLYNILDKDGGLTVEAIRKKLEHHRPGASLETAARYLFDLLLNTMTGLREKQDSYYDLFSQILKARILFEKSLFKESFELLDHVIEESGKYENYYAQLLAQRFELQYLLALSFPGLSEKELLKKQFRLNESLKLLRRINEQSSLFEILKHRGLYKGYPRSQDQKDGLNDLVFSELSIVASGTAENFEISKLHQLFQSHYLITVGDYESALHSYHELNALFESNQHLWDNPPVYYLNMLEGVLESLRGIKNYNDMVYFIDQLKKIKSEALDFKLNLVCLTFQYELFPLLDTGDFKSCLELIKRYETGLYDRFENLEHVRQAELYLYTSLVYLGNSDYRKALKYLDVVVLKGKNFLLLPIYRTIRLVYLIILYQLGDFERILYEIRSMKRDMSGIRRGYKIERLLFRFLSKPHQLTASSRSRKWEKLEVVCLHIQNDVFEQQVLRMFDFTAWIESQVTQVSLSHVLRDRQQRREDSRK
jgi:tetratricopeptide (TPR) repeat protein